MAKVLLFGGSFDPIHNGHLIVSRAAAEQIGAARVVLVPSSRPPHKLTQQLADGADRLEMCRRAVANEPFFDVSDWELGQQGPNYTLLTVQHFRAALGPETEVCWLIGMDSLVELATWYHVAELVDACTVVTAARPGYEDPDLAALEAPSRFEMKQVERLVGGRDHSDRHGSTSRATDIRTRVADAVAVCVISFLMRVSAWITAQGLYCGEAGR